MLRSPAVVDSVAAAQCIEAVCRTRVFLACDVKCIDNTLRQERGKPQEGKFCIEEGHVEARIVDDERRIADEIEKVLRDRCEDRFVPQKCSRKPVYGLGLLRHVALRVDVDMECAAGRQVIEKFERADFNDAVAVCRVKPGGFSIEYDFAQHAHCLAFALMSAITRSTSRAVSARLDDVSIT